jgi:hypothetical protein
LDSPAYKIFPVDARSSWARTISSMGVTLSGEVHPQQIDVVGTEAAQTPLDGAEHRPPLVACLQGSVALVAADRVLGGDREVVATSLQEGADALLGLADLIARGRIDEGAAGVGELVERIIEGAYWGFTWRADGSPRR